MKTGALSPGWVCQVCRRMAQEPVFVLVGDLRVQGPGPVGGRPGAHRTKPTPLPLLRYLRRRRAKRQTVIGCRHDRTMAWFAGLRRRGGLR